MAGADDLRPLDAAIDEIRMLHRAVERAQARIAAESDRVADRGPRGGGVVADLADGLVVRTDAIREDCRRLEKLLERARAAVAADLAPAGPPAPPAPRQLPRPDFLATGIDPRDRPEPAPSGQPVPEGARLIAMQMAVAGASRIEVERRLQRDFGIADTGRLLDEVYGHVPSGPAG